MVSKASEDLPGPGEPGEDDQAVPGQVQVDTAEVVFACALTISRSATRPMLCARTDDFPGRSAQYRDVMTVAVADTYTGHVETRTAARRTPSRGEHHQGLRARWTTTPTW